MIELENIILQYSLYNIEFFEIIISHMSKDVFDGPAQRVIVDIIKKYYIDFNCVVPIDILNIKIKELSFNNSTELNNVLNVYSKISLKPENREITGLLKTTEKYFKRQSIRNVLTLGAEEYEKNSDFSLSLLDKMETALSYSFDDSVAYVYTENLEERLKIYNENVEKIPFSINLLNEYTNGGYQPKTITSVIAATNGGKSIWLCQEAAFNLKSGRNVLYVTLEMSETEISKRIDANLIGTPQDNLKNLNLESAKYRFNNAINKNKGQLYIKEFPADSTTTLDIKKVINDIKRKHKTKIDVLIVDYVGIMLSYRYSTKTSNSYSIGKHTVEELRSLAVNENIPVLTALQFNRGAENNDDLKQIGLGQTADSYGMPMTMDFMFAILHTDLLDSQKKAAFKIIKNRFGERKNSAALFSVIQNNGLSRFEDDSNQTTLVERNDNNTQAGKKIDTKIKCDIIKTTNNDDLFGDIL